MSRKVVRSFFLCIVRVIHGVAVWTWRLADPRYIRAPQPSHRTSFRILDRFEPARPLSPQPIQVSPSRPATKTPPPKTSLLHISAKRVTRKPQESGAGGRSAYLLCSVALSHFPGSPDGFLNWPQGEGAQAQKSTSSGWVAATPKTFPLRNLTERVAATTGIIRCWVTEFSHIVLTCHI